MRKLSFLIVVSLLAICPNTLFASGRAPVVISTYPRNSSAHVQPTSKIGITFTSALLGGSLSPDSISVVGSKHGDYHGSLKLSTNLRTLIFQPTHSFGMAETITVHIGSFATAESMTKPYDFAFKIASKAMTPDSNYHSDDPILELQLHPRRSDHKGINFGATVQSYAPPSMTIDANSHPYDGQLFLANYRFDVQAQLGTFRMILDKNANIISSVEGTPDYYNDFKPLGDGRFSYFDVLADAFYIVDSSFNLVDSAVATNGFLTDGHEFRITPEGDYAILANAYVTVNMAAILPYGDSDARVLEPIIQIFDRDHNLIFEWRTLDHFNITDATYENLLATTVDFCHSNAIEFDEDSNILLSNRHMDEITKINRNTGEIMWRLGGKNNEFTFVGDSVPFSHQHALRRTDSGTITMFDNGNIRGYEGNSYSRALEYKLDEKNKIATKVWEFRHTPDAYGFAMGYVQRLPNGNTLIGWGACNTVSVTEVDPNGGTQFEMVMDSNNFSYRAYKFDSSYSKYYHTASAVSSGFAPTITPAWCAPNPVSTTALFHFSTANEGDANVSIYDQLGKKRLTIFTGELSSGDHSAPFDARDLSPGMYYVRISTSNATDLMCKIMVVK